MVGKLPLDEVRLQCYLLKSTKNVIVDEKKISIIVVEKTRSVRWRKNKEFADGLSKVVQNITSTDGAIAITIGTYENYTMFVIGEKTLRIIVSRVDKNHVSHNTESDYIITDRVQDVVEDIVLSGEAFANHVVHCVAIEDCN